MLKQERSRMRSRPDDLWSVSAKRGRIRAAEAAELNRGSGDAEGIQFLLVGKFMRFI